MAVAATRVRAGALECSLTILLAISLSVLTALPVHQTVRYVAAFSLIWAMPAASWYLRLAGDGLMRAVSGLGLAYVGAALATLLLHLLPGPFPTGLARVAYALLAAFPLLLPRRREVRPASSRSLRWGLVVVLCVALLTRLPNLGYSEFQGDEAVILQRAADALQGDDDELFLHQKGPAEILLPMSVWALSGTTSEWQARLPFVLAGVLAVLSVTALGTSWLGGQAGVVAGLLVAINGFLVAFGRIVQYQSLVVSMGALSLLWVSAYGRRRRLGALALSAVFLGFGMLAHYDAVLVVPAAVALLMAGISVSRQSAGMIRQVLVHLVIAASIGAAVLALFYVPFLRNPMFTRTFNYLLGGRVGGGLPHNSLLSVWRMSTFYNALAYVVGLVLLVIGAAVVRGGTLAAWLYIAVPFTFYAFLVSDPRTHVYTVYPGAALLAGSVVSRLVRSAAVPRALRSVLYVVLGMWFTFCSGYTCLAFIDHRVEYKRTWPESRHPLYPVPFADEELPPYGHFGFPYRAGWKAVEQLFDQGVVSGTYASNEEPEITGWYVRSGDRTMCGRPEVYVVAERVQDQIAIDWNELARDYSLAAEVFVGDTPKIRVYSRGSPPDEVLSLGSREAANTFDRGSLPAVQRTAPVTGLQPVGADFGTVGRLLGYDPLPLRVRRGGDYVVTLHWQALSSPARNYQVLVHLVHGTEIVAQGDGAPACAFAPTALWESGEYIRDEHVLSLDGTAPTGQYDLYVGLYDLHTLERLPVAGAADNRFLLQRLEVIP